jgi:hypothetical protein
MKIRLAMLCILLCGAAWAMAQARRTGAAPPPASPNGTAGQTAQPTTAPPTGAATKPGQVTAPPASIIGPPTPITTQAAGPGSTQTPAAPATPGDPAGKSIHESRDTHGPLCELTCELNA